MSVIPGSCSSRNSGNSTCRYTGLVRDPTVEKTIELHRRIVERLRQDPSLIDRAREILEQWIARAGGAALPAEQEWRDALRLLDVDDMIRFLESDTPRARRMKTSSPFPALLRD